mgnify:CR=1 FL=1
MGDPVPAQCGALLQFLMNIFNVCDTSESDLKYSSDDLARDGLFHKQLILPDHDTAPFHGSDFLLLKT